MHVAEVERPGHRLGLLPRLVVGARRRASIRASAARRAGRAPPRANCSIAGEDRQRRPVDAAELLGAGVDVHERLRRLDQRVAGRRHLAEPRADDEQQVGVADALGELRVDADADVADVARRVVVDRVLAAERGAGGQLVRLEERAQCPARRAASSRRRRAARTAARRAASSAAEALDLLCARVRLHDVERLRVRRRRPRAASMSSGQREHDRARAARRTRSERARDVLGNAVGAVDLRDPLRHRPEHAPVVDLLERLALLLVATRPGRRAGSAASSPGTRCARRPTRASRRGRA